MQVMQVSNASKENMKDDKSAIAVAPRKRRWMYLHEPASHSKLSCCKWEMDNASNLDFAGYNDPGEAALGHLKLCRKWAAKKVGSESKGHGR
jgi:hypothetical protein